MIFYTIISVSYVIISGIVYSILVLSLIVTLSPATLFLLSPPLRVIFCIWLFITTIKLIKKSFVSFSKGKTEQGIGLLLVGILLPAGIIIVYHFFFSLLIGRVSV